MKNPNPRRRAIMSKSTCSAPVSGSLGGSSTTGGSGSTGVSPACDLKSTHSL